MSGILSERTLQGRAWARLGILALTALLLLGLAACKEEEKKDEAAGGQAEVTAPEPEVARKPGIFVGNAYVEFEAPAGFVKVDAAGPAAMQAQSSLDGGELLLGLYYRDSSAQAPQAASDDAELSRAEETLRVTTLEKWLYSHFTAESFAELKAAWQKDSLVCDQQVLGYFAEAAVTRLADYTAYTYNLGMTGYGPEQITFASVSKNTVSDGEVRYVTRLKTLLFRQGKILALTCDRRVENIHEVGKTIDDYMDYLRGLEAHDSTVSGDLGTQTLRGAPGAGPEVSMAD